MRIALIADVHGNTPALRTVLADVASRGTDLVVDLGDIASGALDPVGTVALLRATDRAVHVRGNHERQLSTLPPGRMGPSDRLAYDRLGARDRAWLATLPVTATPAPGVLAFHATPAVDTTYLLHTVTPDGLRDATDAEIVDRLGSQASRHDVFVCGHTHLQRERRLPGGALVVNPGSVGWPAFHDDRPYPHAMEAGTPHARYTLLERDGSGGWTTTPVALDYDVDEAVALATGNARPDVAHAVRHGLVLPSRTTPRGADGDDPAR